MTRTSTALFLSAVVAMMATDLEAFAPALSQRTRPAFLLASSSSTMERPTESPYFADEPKELNVAQSASNTATQEPPKTKKSVPPAPKKKSVGGGAKHKEGLFSPVVYISKMLLGESKLNKLRAKVISMHSDTIAGFVDTYETPVGRTVLKQLFEVADTDKSGTVEQNELQAALRALGFEWLEEKQVSKIFERADLNADGAISLDEWIKEAPKTLRTNLIKLAKKNGGDMGLLV